MRRQATQTSSLLVCYRALAGRLGQGFARDRNARTFIGHILTGGLLLERLQSIGAGALLIYELVGFLGKVGDCGSYFKDKFLSTAAITPV